MDPTLWPCRGVAEHAYCPRLFYYMTIEGVFVPSSDTEEGKSVHRRVDRPSAAPDNVEKLTGAESDPDRPRSVRGLSLTSARLGLTATLDLAEISGMTAVPVEYRKGRPKRGAFKGVAADELMEEATLLPPPEAWPTDRVQVGLQAILLEEAGFAVREAVLYYAAEKVRLCIPVDDALRAEALATLDAAKRDGAGPRPMPLVNDPRCPRCSLQPICLPDEVNQQRLAAVTIEGRTPDDLTPRRLWPPRDDGIHLVAQREGVRIGVRGQSMRVTDRDGEVVRDVPIANVESLAVLGGVQVSTQALTVLADHSIPVAFITGAGRLVAMMDPLGPTSAAVRAAQVRRLDDPASAIALARAVSLRRCRPRRSPRSP